MRRDMLSPSFCSTVSKATNRKYFMEIISRLLNKIFTESGPDEIHETYPQKAAKLA
jgi:hypothetical protein